MFKLKKEFVVGLDDGREVCFCSDYNQHEDCYLKDDMKLVVNGRRKNQGQSNLFKRHLRAKQIGVV